MWVPPARVSRSVGRATAPTDSTVDLAADPDADPPAPLTAAESVPPSDYNRRNTSVTLPDGCFRTSVTAVNVLADYAIEIAPKGANVSWGSVKWEEDPFDGLACESMMVAASDYVDVCDLFDEEVDRAVSTGWDGDEAVAHYSAATGTGGNKITWSAPSKAKIRQFQTVWYDNNNNEKPTKDIYTDAATVRATPPTTAMLVDSGALMLQLLDSDGDPMYGDIGKVDVLKVDDSVRHRRRRTRPREATVLLTTSAAVTRSAPTKTALMAATPRSRSTGRSTSRQVPHLAAKPRAW